MTLKSSKDPRIGRPVQRNVQVDGTWYRPGDVPPTEHALKITNCRVWGDEMGVVPGPGQFETDDDGKVVPPGGQPIEPATETETPAPAEDEAPEPTKRRK